MQWIICTKFLMFNFLVFSTTLPVSNIFDFQERDKLCRAIKPFSGLHLRDSSSHLQIHAFLTLRSSPCRSKHALVSSILRGGSSTLEMAAAAHGWLQYTFSPNQQEREQAEAALRSLETQPGFLPALLTVVNRSPGPFSPSAPPPHRAASAASTHKLICAPRPRAARAGSPAA